MYYLLLFLKNFLNFFLLSNHGKFVSLLEWKWSRDRTFMIESRLERYARMGDSMTLYHLRDLGGTFIKKNCVRKTVYKWDQIQWQTFKFERKKIFHNWKIPYKSFMIEISCKFFSSNSVCHSFWSHALLQHQANLVFLFKIMINDCLFLSHSRFVSVLKRERLRDSALVAQTGLKRNTMVCHSFLW